MADNTQLSAAVGSGDLVRTEDRTGSGPKTPVSLIDVGGTSAEALIGDSGVAMPVRGLAAEDAAASGNPVPAGGRYDSTPRSLEDGDRGEIALTSAGHQYAEISASALPSGAATSAKQDTGNTSLSSIDGKITACNTGAVVVSSSALPSGASTAAKQPALGTAGTASADVITIQGIASMTAVKVDGSAVTQPVSDGGSTLSIDDGGGNISIDDGGNVITVDGTVAVTDNAGSLTVDAPVGTPLFVRLSDGSSAITTLPVSLASVPSHAVTNAGTFAVQESGGALTALQIMDDWDNAASDGASVSGDVAHDSVDAGEPVKIGAKAIAYGANPTAVAAADRTDLYANRHGVLMTLGGVPGIITKEWTFADADGAQTDTALVTVSAGTKIAVTNIAAICDNANTGDVAVRVGFAASSLSAAATTGIAGIVMSHPGIAAGSGYNRGDGSGVLGVGADGEDLRITCEDPAGGSIRIVASYFEIAS